MLVETSCLSVHSGLTPQDQTYLYQPSPSGNKISTSSASHSGYFAYGTWHEQSINAEWLKEKLLNSTGRELRRALFSLKQIFQDDKDLVHEFVQNDGLACLIKVGTEADQNYQNYILRALGQVMLYVDGMNGIIGHNETIQWLYSLLTSQYRLVVKTALKLLLVFVEYTESNSLQLLAAVNAVDKVQDSYSWSNLMAILGDKDVMDLELLIYAMTLVNKTLNGIPDQDTYYDIVDSLDEQGMEEAMQRLIAMGNRELTEQCQNYENVLNQEDAVDGDQDQSGNYKNVATMRSMASRRERTPRRAGGRMRAGAMNNNNNNNNNNNSPNVGEDGRVIGSKSRIHNLIKGAEGSTGGTGGGLDKDPDCESQRVPLTPRNETPGLSEQKRLTMDILYKYRSSVDSPDGPPDTTSGGGPDADGTPTGSNGNSGSSVVSQSSTTAGKVPLSSAAGRHGSQDTDQNENIYDTLKNTKCPPPMMPDLTSPQGEMGKVGGAPAPPPAPSTAAPPPPSAAAVEPAKPKHPDPPPNAEEDGDVPSNPFAAALKKKKNKMKTTEAGSELFRDPAKESEEQWQQAVSKMSDRPLIINDLDFTDMDQEDDQNPFVLARQAAINAIAAATPGLPPPPPMSGPPPPPPPGGAPPPPPFRSLNSPAGPSSFNSLNSVSKDDGTKTLRLHWREANFEPPQPAVRGKGVFWQKLKPPEIDAAKLGQLFETKQATNTISTKKKEEKKQQILVLGSKRSMNINVALTKLPPPKAIKTAILKFDPTILNKEGIQKILRDMLPTEEEKEKILQAQTENPDTPLGPAEQFLHTLSCIPELVPRLKLWLFMLDYANIEKEIADPLMDLKLCMEELESSKTFQYVMATLLAVGNYLNGAEIKGFQLDYLSKVSEVKDTVHKHSLVHHLCLMVMEKFPDSTDLYSELGAVARCSKVDFKEIKEEMDKMERECKASWEYLRLIAKHESPSLKQKISDFLADCAQRISTIKIIHRRVNNRFFKFLFYMGMPPEIAKDTQVNTICKTITEFSLDYRNSRDRIQQMQKRAIDKRERRKTRGKIWATEGQAAAAAEAAASGARIPGRSQDPLSPSSSDPRHQLQPVSTNVPAPPSPRLLNSYDKKRHDDLKNILTDDTAANPHERNWGTQRRVRPPPPMESTVKKEGKEESPDDEILDGLVKTATLKTDGPPRDRRKARTFNRKSLRRTRTLKLVEDQMGP